MEPDNEKLLEYLRESNNEDYLQLTPKPMWGEFKKRLAIQGEVVIDTETGEVVECVTVNQNPDTFVVDI